MKKCLKMMALIMAALITVTATRIMAHAITENRPDVYSPGTMGGVHAYGHTEYVSNKVSAYTGHSVVSSKQVTLYGIYLENGVLKWTGSVTAGSTQTQNASAQIYLPSASSTKFYVGSHADHTVNYMTMYCVRQDTAC